jgi:flagellin
MPFSIQTNVNSLIAQENLRVNSNFQNQTIQRLTSGYRINSSGDDAAGLAIANKFRSDTAELSQGVRNANDGVAQLQIMDGGMNNIGKMLDRLKTLATQSASGTFTGKRSVLNTEYQSLITEIDRQAQGIGLSTGGHFAAKMGVYIGGGTTAGGAADTSNGTVNLDLTNSVVDTKALGLRTSEFKAGALTGTNLSAASNTSIGNIVTANGGTATFKLQGAGFSTNISVAVASNDTTTTLAAKLNQAIQAAGNTGTTDGNGLNAAAIQANAVTDATGNQQLSFTSAGSAFQVTAATKTANALMGYFDASTASTNPALGASVSQTVQGSAVGAGGADAAIRLRVYVDGVATDLDVSLRSSDNTDAEYENKVQAATNYSQLTDKGVTATVDTTTHQLKFVGDSNQSIHVEASGDSANTLGFGQWAQAAGYTIGKGAITTSKSQTATIVLTVNGNDVTVNATTVAANDTTNAKVLAKLTSDASYTNLLAAGVSASLDSSNHIVFTGDAGQTITVKSSADANNVLGYGVAAPDADTTTNAVRTSDITLAAGGAGDKATVSFSINGGDKIMVSFTSDGTGLAADAQKLQDAIDSNQQLASAGITVGASLANITSANTNTNFRVAVESQSGTLNLGMGVVTSSPKASYTTTDKAAMLSAGGSSETGLGTNNDVFAFSGMTNTGGIGGANGDQQVISFSATAADGSLKTTSVTLTSENAHDVDAAISEINSKLQGTGDTTLKKIVAVKETNAAGTAEGIRFISSLNSFSVGVGTTNNSTSNVPVGMYDGTSGATTRQGMTVESSASGAIDITSIAGAQQAVVALGEAVSKLGTAQAAIGKGQNQLGYAINLAQSQISNFSAAESRIRDADVAAEAANLTKAQVLQQASMAAMAQANSAPQAVLSLLRG